MNITEVKFTPVPADIRSAGLLGFVTFVLDERIQVDGVAVRVTQSGRMALSFPSRRDRRGVEHYLIRPLTGAVRRTIEEQVFRVLGELS